MRRSSQPRRVEVRRQLGVAELYALDPGDPRAGDRDLGGVDAVLDVAVVAFDDGGRARRHCSRRRPCRRSHTQRETRPSRASRPARPFASRCSAAASQLRPAWGRTAEPVRGRAPRHGAVSCVQRSSRLLRSCGGVPGVPAVGPGLDEELGGDRVELRARPVLDLGERVLVGERLAVRPWRDHRVERVGDREDPGLDRDAASAQPRRVAAAVPALVVEEDVRERVVEPPQRQDEPRAGGRVAPDLRDLLERERPRLAEQLRAELDLADVVQRRGPAQRADPLAVPAQLQRDRLGERGDAVAVAEGLVALFERACDRLRACPRRIPRADAATPTSSRCRRSASRCARSRAAAGPRRPRSSAAGRSGSSPS